MRTLTALALAGGLCLSGVSAAMADEANPATGTAESPAQAKITKVLEMPDGTETPVEEFVFEFTRVSVDDVTGTSTNMPTIPNATVSYNGSETAAAVSGVISIPKQTTDNILKDVSWPHAGVYVYTISEATGTNDDMAYSAAVYELWVWVSNCDSGTGCDNGLYVSGISTYAIEDDEGDEVEPKVKVDPTPGDGSTTFSNLAFKNVYVETNDGDPTDPEDHMLNVSKEVTGEYADQTYHFPFTVTVTKPSTGVAGTPVYKGYVVEEDGDDLVIVTSEANCTSTYLDGPSSAKYCKVTSGTAITINLKHGQQLVFVDLHVGATYTAVEAYDDRYDASVDVTANGVGPTTLTPADAGDPMSTGPQVIGANENSAAFTNDRVGTTPTGLRLNDLPFVGLIVLGLAAIVVMVVVRRGKSRA